MGGVQGMVRCVVHGMLHGRVHGRCRACARQVQGVRTAGAGRARLPRVANDPAALQTALGPVVVVPADDRDAVPALLDDRLAGTVEPLPLEIVLRAVDLDAAPGEG